MKAVLKQKVYDRFLAVVVFWKVNGEMFVLNEVSKTKTHTHKKKPTTKSNPTRNPLNWHRRPISIPRHWVSFFLFFLRRCGVKDNVITVVSGSASIDLW